MSAQPAAPWGRLAPLAGVVLAAHLLVLQETARWFAPAQQAPAARTLVARVVIAPTTGPAPEAPGGTIGLQEAAPRQPKPASRRSVVSAANPDSRARVPTPLPLVAPPATPSAQPTPLLAPPPPATLHYEVTVHRRGAVLHGRARLDWRHDGEAYELRQALSAPALPPRVHASRGRIAPHGLVPEYFHARARGEQATHFDHAGGRVVFSSNSPQAALDAGMQDPLSVVMQLSMALAADAARITPGARITVPTAGTRDAGPWIFEVMGTEDLDLPGGRMPALKLERPPRSTYDQRIELWLAPREAYAPVRLRLTTPDGGWVDQRWASTDRP